VIIDHVENPTTEFRNSGECVLFGWIAGIGNMVLGTVEGEFDPFGVDFAFLNRHLRMKCELKLSMVSLCAHGD